MTSVGYDEIKALTRMAESGDPFIARFASATLSVVEGLRDAEIRAATAEAALATEHARITAIRETLATLGSPTPSAGIQPFEMLRSIAQLAG